MLFHVGLKKDLRSSGERAGGEKNSSIQKTLWIKILLNSHQLLQEVF